MYTDTMKYLFFSILVLVGIFTLPSWVSFLLSIILITTRKLPVLAVGITSIILDVLYQNYLFDSFVPLYSFLAIFVSLGIVWLPKRLA